MPATGHNCKVCGKPCDCMDFMVDESIAYEAGDLTANWYGDVIGTDYYDCTDCTECNEATEGKE